MHRSTFRGHVISFWQMSLVKTVRRSLLENFSSVQITSEMRRVLRSRSFLGATFHQPTLFGLLGKKLSSTEPITVQLQATFHYLLNGLEADVEVRNNPIRADSIIAGDSLLVNVLNP